MAEFSSATLIAITLLFSALGFGLWVAKRKRSLSKTGDQKPKRASDFIIMIGLVLSSVLDPAAKNRIEALDSQRKKKSEAGKENE